MYTAMAGSVCYRMIDGSTDEVHKQWHSGNRGSVHGAGLSASETLAAQQASLDMASAEASSSTDLELSEEASVPESVSSIACETDGVESRGAPEIDSNAESREAEPYAEGAGVPGPLLKWDRPMAFR